MVQLAFLGQKLTSKSAHEPGTQSMGDNDIPYRTNCVWAQHYPVTLNTAKHLQTKFTLQATSAFG